MHHPMHAVCLPSPAEARNSPKECTKILADHYIYGVRETARAASSLTVRRKPYDIHGLCVPGKRGQKSDLQFLSTLIFRNLPDLTHEISTQLM